MQRIALAGDRGQKADLLVAIKKSQPVGAKELGATFGVTTNALRRHLDALEEDGVIARRSEVRGVGAPVHLYFLTPAGESLFPQASADALGAMLDAVVAAGVSDEVVAVFRRRWETLARQAKPLMAGLSFSERAQLVAELLSAEGYLAEVSVADGDRLVITEHHCAVRAVAERFPELCEAEQRFLEDLLGTPVERQARVLDGCNHCAFHAQPDPTAGAASAA
ncbi:MAG: helix-turn-helix transcriptional regulator [Gemmatimonadota bacterium]